MLDIKILKKAFSKNGNCKFFQMGIDCEKCPFVKGKMCELRQMINKEDGKILLM